MLTELLILDQSHLPGVSDSVGGRRQILIRAIAFYHTMIALMLAGYAQAYYFHLREYTQCLL
jgi:hypothetical protein